MVGPHFEALCRDWAAHAGDDVFSGFPAEVAAAAIADPGNRTQIQVDVAVFPPEPLRNQNACSRLAKRSGVRSWAEGTLTGFAVPGICCRSEDTGWPTRSSPATAVRGSAPSSPRSRQATRACC